MTVFQAKVLHLWDRGMDTLQIAQELAKTEGTQFVHVPESQVYRALNAARHERKLRAYMDGE